MTSYRTPLFFAQAVGRVVRARGPHESATVFLPAVRPLLALAAELEDERNHVMPPPKTGAGDELDLDPLPPKEKRRPTGCRSGRRWRPTPGSPTCCTAGPRTPARAPARPARWATRTRTSSASPACSPPSRPRSCWPSGTTSCGCASPRATATTTPASCRSSRTTPTRTTPAGRGGTPPSCAARSTGWSAACRRRRRTPHAVVHTQLRQSVPGPPSASASVDVLRARRERLRTML